MKHTYLFFVFIVLSFLAIPALDYLFQTNLTSYIYSQVKQSLLPFTQLPSGKGLLFEGLVIIGFYSLLVLFLYIIVSLFAFPIALIAWSIVTLPVLGSRFIDKLFPENPLVIIFFTIWLITILYLGLI